MASKLVHVASYAGGMVGPSIPMLGPVEDGGTIVATTAPCCWGGLITPHMKSGHEVSRPVAVEGARAGDALVIWIKKVQVASLATSSGTSQRIEGRKVSKGTYLVTRCPQCGAEGPETYLDGIGPQAIKCKNCGAAAIPIEMPCGYTMVFDEQRGLGVTVGKAKAEEIAWRAREYGALPAESTQHSVLVLAKADVQGILARVRPMVGNLGTTPAVDMSASANCGDLAQRDLAPYFKAAAEQGSPSANPLTDGHLDIDSVREGAILICPVKIDGAGIYLGDVHAMQGDGEIAGHTTDVAAEVTVQVHVLKGLTLEGPILLPPEEDLPFLARPFTRKERGAARRLARQWGVELEEVAPIQVIGSGADLNSAARNGLERAARLLNMSVDEVRNRATVSGSVEIGRAPGVITVSLLAPVRELARLGILDLVKGQYGL